LPLLSKVDLVKLASNLFSFYTGNTDFGVLLFRSVSLCVSYLHQETQNKFCDFFTGITGRKITRCCTDSIMKCTGSFLSLRRSKLYALMITLPTFIYFEIKWEFLEFWIILKFGINMLFPSYLSSKNSE
jgi:hypothetical protein